LRRQDNAANQAAGAITKVVSPKSGKLRGWNHKEWGEEVRVDQEVVVDENLVTSRKPDDIPAFNREIISLFSQVRH
jgi:hypothetical protein